MNVEQSRATQRRVLALGGILPVTVAVAATVAMLAWVPRLPNAVAIHWSGTVADGFASLWVAIALPLAVVVPISVIAVVAGWRPGPSGRPAWTQKFVIVIVIWASALLSVAMTGTLAAQLDAAEPTGTETILVPLLFGAVLGIGLAAAAWFLLPKTDSTRAEGVAPDPVPLAPSERVYWSRRVGLSRAVTVIVASALFLAVLAVGLTATLDSRGNFVSIGVLVLIVILTLSTAVWQVTADANGLVVRSALGWPRVVVATEEIRSVQVVDINPTAQFGGWGYRWDLTGRSGVVMRAGEAIEVTRESGKRFVVTVDDARTGAAVLAAYARARAT